MRVMMNMFRLTERRSSYHIISIALYWPFFLLDYVREYFCLFVKKSSESDKSFSFESPSEIILLSTGCFFIRLF